MIFKENIDSQQLIALINQDNDVEKYVCSLWTCENPICACNTITINFSPFPFPDNEVSSNQNIPAHTIEFDLVTKTLNNENISEEDLEFAEMVLAQLEEDDFRILQKRHFLYKNQSTERADVNTIEACFDYQEIERNGLMPAYNDVLPYGNQLQVTIDHKDYLALDQYCLLPKCPCSDTTLTLIPVDGLHKGDGNEFCSIDVNYRKKQWKNFERLSSGLSEQSIRSVIEEQVKDLYKTLHQRHLKLKAIYKNCRKKHLTSNQLTKIVKIGRNDSCPCGSGKKFKKCCLRKSS